MTDKQRIEELTQSLINLKNVDEMETNRRIAQEKEKIRKFIQCDYDDFTKYIENDPEHTEDNYESMKFMLQSIFKTLKKNNINLD